MFRVLVLALLANMAVLASSEILPFSGHGYRTNPDTGRDFLPAVELIAQVEVNRLYLEIGRKPLAHFMCHTYFPRHCAPKVEPRPRKRRKRNGPTKLPQARFLEQIHGESMRLHNSATLESRFEKSLPAIGGRGGLLPGLSVQKNGLGVAKVPEAGVAIESISRLRVLQMILEFDATFQRRVNEERMAAIAYGLSRRLSQNAQFQVHHIIERYNPVRQAPAVTYGFAAFYYATHNVYRNVNFERALMFPYGVETTRAFQDYFDGLLARNAGPIVVGGERGVPAEQRNAQPEQDPQDRHPEEGPPAVIPQPEVPEIF